MTLHANIVLRTLEHFLGIGNLVQAKFFGHLGAYLGCIAVNGLATSDDDIHVGAKVLDGRGQRIAGGQCVGSGKGTVGEEVASVGTTIDSLADDLGGTAGAHRKHDYRRAGILLFEAERLLQGIKVFGIENGWQCTAIYRALGGHGIGAYIARVRNLLGKYNNF